MIARVAVTLLALLVSCAPMHWIARWVSENASYGSLAAKVSDAVEDSLPASVGAITLLLLASILVLVWGAVP